MGKVTEITSFEQFKDIIARDQYAILDFWATWCGPCKLISPIFEKFSEKYDSPNVAFYKVDADEQEEVVQAVDIRTMPVFKAFRRGKEVGQSLGAVPADLESLIQQCLESPKDIEPPKDVEEPPKDVEEPPKDVEEPPKAVEESPKDVEEPPKDVEKPQE